VEVPTDAESLRAEVDTEGGNNATWVGDPVVPAGGSWPQPPVEDKLTEAELQFLEDFWAKRSVSKTTKAGARPDFVVSVTKEGGDASAATPEALSSWNIVEDDVIANDLTTPEQEAVLAQRAKVGILSPTARQKRTEQLAQHFDAREKTKACSPDATDDGTPSGTPSPPAAEPVVPSTTKPPSSVSVPPSAFFEEKLEVFTAEDVPKAIARYKEEEAADIDKRAEIGAKLTTFGSPTSKGGGGGFGGEGDAEKETGGAAAEAGSVVAASGMLEAGSAFAFKSAGAKSKVDSILNRRAADVERIRQQAQARNEARNGTASASTAEAASSEAESEAAAVKTPAS